MASNSTEVDSLYHVNEKSFLQGTLYAKPPFFLHVFVFVLVMWHGAVFGVYD